MSLLLRGQISGYEDALTKRVYTRSLRCKSIKGSIFVMKRSDFLWAFKQNARTWTTVLQMAKLNDTILNNVINPQKRQANTIEFSKNIHKNTGRQKETFNTLRG